MASQRRLTVWILGSFAFLWSAVLPFICWGTWAAPGHAHAAPHFVFAAPTSPRHLPAHDGTAAESTEEDAQPVGAAHPDSLVVSLLLIVLLRLWYLPRPRRHTQTALPRSLGSRPVWPTVPTPPPRPLSTLPA